MQCLMHVPLDPCHKECALLAKITKILAWATSTGSFAGCEDCTYHGVLHHEAQRRLGGQVQGPCHNVHIIAGLCQQVHKALEARPVVPAPAQQISLGNNLTWNQWAM